MSKPLFRKEVFEARRARAMGETKNIASLPGWVFTIFMVIFAIIFILFTIFAQYSRRERADGYLALDVTPTKLVALEAAKVHNVFVKEGQVVKKDQPIISLSSDKEIDGQKSTASISAKELKYRKNLLQREKATLELLFKQQLNQNEEKINNLKAEKTFLEKEILMQEERLNNAQATYQKYQELQKSNFISDEILRQKHNEYSEQSIKLQASKRLLSQTESNIQNLLLEAPLIKLRSNNQIEQTNRQISEIDENLEILEGKKESLIRSPVDGWVANLNLSVGDLLPAETNLATIVPSGSLLYAELLVPSRAAGFVKIGQKVSIRYDAFPYQKYGQFGGIITKISPNISSPGEKIGPFNTREPVYRIYVTLDSQTISSFDQPLLLKPGMLLNADLILEKRTILEWILEPVLKLRGNW